MVSPVYLIAIALLAAFGLGLFRKARISVPFAVTCGTLVLMSLVSSGWVWHILSGHAGVSVYIAGFKPPFSINLHMGLSEAVLTLLVNLAVLFSMVMFFKTEKVTSVYPFMLVLVFTMGLNGIILTRDLFNLFVFFEVVGIAAAGLIAVNGGGLRLGAGFKYVLAGTLAGSLLLLGIVFNYHATGSLNIDVITRTAGTIPGAAGFIGPFLVFIGIIIELKPFPANGWGLDVYQAAPPAVSAMIAAGSTTAFLYAFSKAMAMTGTLFLPAAAVIGTVTFLGSNLVALKQPHARRLLGYSSIGQAGLLVLVYALCGIYGITNDLPILFGILVSHAAAKALLFWVSAVIKQDKVKEWGGLAQRPLLLVLFGAGIFALIGMPPFPSFFAKYRLALELASQGGYGFLAVILTGSLLEAVYLMRWLGYAVKNPAPEKDMVNPGTAWYIPAVLAALLPAAAGYFLSRCMPLAGGINWILPLAVLVLYVLDFLPARVKTALSVAAAVYYGIPLIRDAEGFRVVFAAIFTVGAAITLLPGFGVKGRRTGFYPSVMLMFAGLFGLIEAKDTMSFFFAWELMTVGSYILILRGHDSRSHALSYLLFSLGGAYAILAAFALTFAGTGAHSISLDMLTVIGGRETGGIVFLLLALGFMTKTASGGLHIWLPGAHAEAEGDVSPMVSGILLKAGILGLFIIVTQMGRQSVAGIDIPYMLGWLGAFTMLIGNYMAAMQEDAKRLLAYSSIGQMGFALFCIALMSHLGWLAALALVVSHFIYKVTLFLAVGGIVARVKTKNMYEMGGLITRMPITFISVLICIIALSGIPPLAGYAAKWITYNAVLAKGWLLQGAVVSIAGFVAFLYLFRLIFTIFLGQLKDNHRRVKEAPFFMLLPQVLLLGAMMVFSFRPASLLSPLGTMLRSYTAEGALDWHGFTAVSQYGHWDGLLVMLTFMGIFAVLAAVLFILMRRAERVKQFNIVYAAERPGRPETTHFAYNFFAHYRKAVGFLEFPLATRFWTAVTDIAHGTAGMLRFVYTGNGQTYLVQILAFVVVSYLLVHGGF